MFLMVKVWQVSNIALKRSCRRCSIKRAVLKNLAILIGKHLCWSFFLINLQAYSRRLQTPIQMFSCEYCKIFKSIYSKGHLWRTASEIYWSKVEERNNKKNCEFCEISKNTYSYRTPQVAASLVCCHLFYKNK